MRNSVEAKTVLVTGAAGFLGSHLCDALLSRGHRVIGVDDLSHGKRENLAQATENPRFAFHVLDITDAEKLRRVSEDVDVFAHLAAFKIPRYGDRIKTLMINSQGSLNVLQLAAERKAKFLFTSTSDVYGKNPDIPFSETSASVIGSSTVPRWAYAVSKLFDEHLAFSFHEDHDIPVTVVRIFGSYGPRQHLSWWGGPQSVFIDSVLRNEQIPIHGDGLQTRSFTYVSDTVSGILAALESDAANNQIINIGSTHEITIVDLARLIHRLIESPEPLRLEFVPYKQISGRDYEDVRRRVPDVAKAEKLLGFKAAVSLEEGLLRTIEWQRAVRGISNSVVVGA
jgi:UDP-glucose 4-epimerase